MLYKPEAEGLRTRRADGVISTFQFESMCEARRRLMSQL